MAAISETLRHDLRDQEFAEVYAETFLDTYVSTQIKVLREQREMTQTQLARELHTTQTVISRIESVNYSAWNIKTLKKIARALGVRLRVSFETFGSLIDDMERFDRETLKRHSLANDPILQGSTKRERLHPSTRVVTNLDGVQMIGAGGAEVMLIPELTQEVQSTWISEDVRFEQHEDDVKRAELLALVPKPIMARAWLHSMPQVLQENMYGGEA